MRKFCNLIFWSSLSQEKEFEMNLKRKEDESQQYLKEKEAEMMMAIEERELQKMAAVSAQDSQKDELQRTIDDMKTVREGSLLALGVVKGVRGGEGG